VPDPAVLPLFIGAALALLIVPGPAVMYIVTRSIDQGRAAGLVSVLGIASGSLVHVTAASLGLSALLASSAVAFNTVKLLGAAYLIFIGVRRLLTRETEGSADRPEPKKLSRIYLQGVVVNVLNPKTALFFFAFLPQFVRPERGSVALQIAVLGVLFASLGILSDGTYALVSSAAGSWLRTSRRFRGVQRYVSGTVFVGLGLTAAFTGSRSSA
jgi:threonine/homoserine/homoserine lactone efflux protein